MSAYPSNTAPWGNDSSWSASDSAKRNKNMSSYRPVGSSHLVWVLGNFDILKYFWNITQSYFEIWFVYASSKISIYRYFHISIFINYKFYQNDIYTYSVHRCQFIYFWGGPRSPIMSNFDIRPMALYGIRMELKIINLTFGPQSFSEIDTVDSVYR